MHGIGPHQFCVSVLPAIHKALQEPGKKNNNKEKAPHNFCRFTVCFGLSLKIKEIDRT